MAKKNAWKIELKLLSRFLNVLANNDFKWKDGERVADLKPFCFSETMLLVEESPKVISYTEYYLYVGATREEYNIIEVTEEMLKGMESVLQSHALCDDGGLFKPEYGEKYWFTSGSTGVYESQWDNHPTDRSRYSVGNCFSTEQKAEDTVRALKLIQKARESQGGFAPDWQDGKQRKYYLFLYKGEIDIGGCFLASQAPALGYWGNQMACRLFAKENYEKLLWFFTEYQE